jgi:hypothetical protein
MLFNPDMTKQAVEVVFSKSVQATEFEPLDFNGIPSKQEEETLHLGLLLDRKLNFESHVEEKLTKARSGLGVMQLLKNGSRTRYLKLFTNYMSDHI